MEIYRISLRYGVKIDSSVKINPFEVNRSSRPDVFCKSVLRCSKDCNFIKKETLAWHRGFPVNFEKFLKTSLFGALPVAASG